MTDRARVLVTGCHGYIGSVLTAELAARGHEVLGLDTGFYADGRLFAAEGPAVPCLARDVRAVAEDDVRGVDAVVHLAELSNDPLGEHDPEVTYDINYRGTVSLAALCRRARVPRFVYASSCSVYGVANGDALMTEASPTNPQTVYADCKVLVERELAAMAGDDFSPVILRNATAYGPSPRMRFDLVLNNLAGLAWTRREIRMASDGTPWRPLVHVRDICQAVACALEAPRAAVHKETFNVGDTAANYRVREIAEAVSRAVPGCTLTAGARGGDSRSYRVSFAKINRRLPGFRCRYDLDAGARELVDLFGAIGMTRETFESPPFTRLAQLRRLLEAGRLDRRFYWRPAAPAAEAA